MKELLEEGTAGQPHPAARIHAEISIQEQLIKYLHGDSVGQSASMDLLPGFSPSYHMPHGEETARTLLLIASQEGSGGDPLNPGIPPHAPPQKRAALAGPDKKVWASFL